MPPIPDVVGGARYVADHELLDFRNWDRATISSRATSSVLLSAPGPLTEPPSHVRIMTA